MNTIGNAIVSTRWPRVKGPYFAHTMSSAMNSANRAMVIVA
jgi:hypothetical protein